MSNLIDNTDEVLAAIEAAKMRALEIIGGKIESYAKRLVPVDTGNLRNSITHSVEDDAVIVSSNVFYAPYVELGTGSQYDPPPEWMENNAKRGSGIVKRSVKPRPYLRPAVENHMKEYEHIMDNELKKG